MFPEPSRQIAGDHAAKELEQAAIAWTVDACGTRDGHGQSVRCAATTRDALPFNFRFLINIAGPKRCIFVRGRMLDVAVHANRTACTTVALPRPRQHR